MTAPSPQAPRSAATHRTQHVLVTGGAGYIGSVLAPKLLAAGHRVTVLDALFFGREPLASVLGSPDLELIEQDIRDHAAVAEVFERGDYDAVIHLAAISNDPCSELDEELTRAVNLTALENVITQAEANGVSRFLYASSASVYGLKQTPDVTEDMELEPITLYARYKAEGEQILSSLISDSFCGVSVRAATVCGYSPRLRLDLTINILTHFAITQGFIRVFGGDQMRPNVHIEDLTDLYRDLLELPADTINGRAFNISRENSSVMGLAELVRDAVDPALPIEVVPTEDNRSYSLTAARAERELGFTPRHTLSDAVAGLVAAYQDGRVPEPDGAIHRNIDWMKQHRSEWIEWRAPAGASAD